MSPIAEWKTYLNEKYKYSVKHPQNWFVYNGEEHLKDNLAKDPQKLIIISPKEPDQFNNLLAGDLSAFEDGFTILADAPPFNKTELDIENYRVEDVMISNKRGVKVASINTVIGEPITNYYIDVSGKTYVFSFENTDLFGGHASIYDQVLSTFEFTN